MGQRGDQITPCRNCGVDASCKVNIVATITRLQRLISLEERGIPVDKKEVAAEEEILANGRTTFGIGGMCGVRESRYSQDACNGSKMKI